MRTKTAIEDSQEHHEPSEHAEAQNGPHQRAGEAPATCLAEVNAREEGTVDQPFGAVDGI